MPVKNLKKQHSIFKTVFLILAIFTYANTSIAIDGVIDESTLPIPTQIPELEEQIGSEMSPKFPKPGEAVKITLSAFGTDLNLANITWSIDDKIIKQGKGQKTFETVAGKLGQLNVIKVEIEPLNGNKVTKTFSINPQTVDVLWEARTYTPPFYKGKSMYTPEEKIIFVAMPNITNQNKALVDSKNIIYKWGQSNQVLGSMSGYGQNVLPYTGNILMRAVETTIEAKSEDYTTAVNELVLAPIFPEMNIYEDSSIYGILFNKEVSGGFEFGNKEERSLSAFPYFIGADNRIANNLVYNWSINYNKIQVPEDQTKMVFRNVDNVEGKSLVKASVKNKDKFLQKSEASTMINFKKVEKPFEF
jgi:hypothetical protein